MCEKAKTIGDPENQGILNRLCNLLERRLAKKKEKDAGVGTGKRNAGLVSVISIHARTHDARTRTTHVPTRSMTWTLTDHNVGPLSSLGLGCGYTGGALLMAGGRVHESGPFEARQVHEERQGPVRGTEGAWSVPSPSLCVGTCMGGDLNRGDQIWGITPGGFTSGSSWISTQADHIWICGYSTLCEIASFSGRSHLLEIASQIQSREIASLFAQGDSRVDRHDGRCAAQGVDEHAALQGPQVCRAQLGQLDDALFERRAHLLQQIRAHGVQQDGHATTILADTHDLDERANALL